MKMYLIDLKTQQFLPLYEIGLSAGFPSPAQDYAASAINLNVALLLDSENTGIIKVVNDDLAGVNIFEGDLAIIATDILAGIDDKVYCRIDDEDVNRIVGENNDSVILFATNNKIHPVVVDEEINCIVYGVITYTITSHVPYRFYPKGDKKNKVDLNKLLIKNKTHTFFGIIQGNSMKEANIFDGDLAIIDRSLDYLNGYVALCQIQDKFTIKYLEWDKKEPGTLWLMPANKEFPPIKVNNDESIIVWGIVTHTITPHNRKFNLP